MSDASRSTNRLAEASSPYLRLHRHNPVDWYPWGREALGRAAAEDKPIFLSVGYSTCYWCHVMERESFSDPGIARLMNRDFVNVKLDREERPDLDEVYMVATQVLTGQGGWPNSVFLTPELKPWFAGTYFPPEDRHGRPGFATVLRSLAAAWAERRDDVETRAGEVAGALERFLDQAGEAGDPELTGGDLAAAALEALEQRFDSQWGGFGSAPKFPTPSSLWLLDELAGEHSRAEEMLAVTLDRMARGGIYDQLGGGFHRYATDREWKIPHFEKMLYDNGLLLEIYGRRAGSTGDPESARIARETAAFLERELRSPEGAYWSAIDAETGGREGAYHVWSREELLEVLGEEDFGFLAPLYGFDVSPFFEEEAYVLHLPAPLEEQAARRRTTREELLEQMAPKRLALLTARQERPRPLTDDKVLVDWNGMAIAGLAEAGRALDEAALVEAAAAASRFLLEAVRSSEGVLLHAWRAGKGEIPAFLSDYAYLVRGLLALHAATGEGAWLQEAVRLTDEQVRRLGTEDGGYYASAEAPDVLVRSREIFDGALPAANGVAALNLLELARRTGEARWGGEAKRLLGTFGVVAAQRVAAANTFAVAAARFGDVATSELLTSTRLDLSPGTAEDWREFTLELAVAPGWHLDVTGEEGGEGALDLAGDGLELRRVALPSPESMSLGGESRTVHRGSLSVTGELRGAPGRLTVHYRLCDEGRCLPAATLSLDVSD